MKTKRQNWAAGPLMPPVPQGGSTPRRTSKPPKERLRLTAAELAEWVERAKGLPDLRWEKVQAVREALRNRTYDLDGRISEVCRRLRQDWPGLVPSDE